MATKKEHIFAVFRELRIVILTLLFFVIANILVTQIPIEFFPEHAHAENSLRVSDDCGVFPSELYFASVVQKMKDDPNFTILILGDSTAASHLLEKEDTTHAQWNLKLKELGKEENQEISLYNFALCKGVSKDSYYMLKYLVKHGVMPDMVVVNVPTYFFHLTLENQNTAAGFNELVVRDFLYDENEQEAMEELGLSTSDFAFDYYMKKYVPLYHYRTEISDLLFGCHPRDFVHEILDSAGACGEVEEKELNYYTYWRDIPEFRGKTFPKKPDYVSKEDLFSEDFLYARYLEKFAAFIEEEKIPTIAYVSPTNDYFYNSKYLNPIYDEKKQIVKTLLEDAGVYYFDLEKSLKEKNFGDKHHVNAKGAKALAHIMHNNFSPIIQKYINK